MENGKIYEAMSEIISEIGFISKDKKCTQGASFAYRGIDDVYNVLNPLLAKNKVFILPSVFERIATERTTKAGSAAEMVIVTMDYTFCHADGSSVTCRTMGQAMDSGDKATNKAMSAAMKYAILQTFCIPTEDMKTDDPDYTHEECAPRKQHSQQQANTPKTQTAQPAQQTQAQAKQPIKPELHDLEAVEFDIVTCNTEQELTDYFKSLRLHIGHPQRDTIGAMCAKRKAELVQPAPTEGATPPADSKLSAAQNKAIQTYYSTCGLDRPAKLKHLSEFFQRTITTTNELSKDEASRLIEAFKQQEQAA